MRGARCRARGPAASRVLGAVQGAPLPPPAPGELRGAGAGEGGTAPGPRRLERVGWQAGNPVPHRKRRGEPDNERADRDGAPLDEERCHADDGARETKQDERQEERPRAAELVREEREPTYRSERG